MTKTVTINGKTYNLPEFNFKDMCDLEDLGFDLQQFAHKPMKHALILCEPQEVNNVQFSREKSS